MKLKSLYKILPLFWRYYYDKFLKTPRRKTKENLTDLQCGNDFLDTTQKSMIHERINWALMLDFIKNKTSL